MRVLALLLLAGVALGSRSQYFRPQSCSCSGRQEASCFDGFGRAGQYSYFYETHVQHYIPGYEGRAEFRLGAQVDFNFFKDSCIAELYVYNVTAFDTSYRYNSSQYDFFTYYRQQAFNFGERELFYKYNESLPRYRFYFCFNGGYIGEVYPHRDEPIWSINFKRGILSTFQARFCPTRGQYSFTETSVEGSYCPYEYTFNTYDRNNFTVYKNLQYDRCHYRPDYYSSSFYGNTFQGGERPLSVSGQTYYRYYNRAIQRIQYHERYQFRLQGYTFQGQDYGSVYSYISQEFTFRNYYFSSRYNTFRGMERAFYHSDDDAYSTMLYQFGDSYYPSHYRYGGRDEVFTLVRDITQYRQQSYQGEFLDRFHELQQRLRYFTFEDYKFLYQRFQIDSYCRSVETQDYGCRRTFFESFITTGTDASARFFKYLVQHESSFFGRDDQFFAMYSFLYGTRISEEYLRAVYYTCERFRDDEHYWGKCALVLSSLTNKYCQQSSCPYVDYTTFDFTNNNQQFSSYYGFLFKYFYGQFYQSRGTYSYRSFVAFRALGNFVRGGFSYTLHQSFYPFFYSVAFNQGFNYPSEYRLAAFEYYAYCSRYFYSEIYREFYRYFYDESQPTEYRIAAFNGILYSFKYGYYQYSDYWRQIFRVLETTRDYQFYCYSYSYLYRLTESDYYPDKYWTSSIAYYFRQYGYYYTGRLYRCRNYGYFASQVQHYTYSPSYFFRGAPYNFFGGRFFSSVQYRRNSTYYQFPQRFNYRFDGFYHNQEYQPFEFGFQSDDFQRMFEYFYSPDGYFFRNGEQPTRDLNQFKFSFFFRMFEYELFYEEFTGSDITNTFERQFQAFQTYRSFYRLFKDGFTYRGFSDLLYYFKSFGSFSGFRFFTDRTWYDQVFNFDKTFRTIDFQYTIPTRIGFPLVYNLTSYMHFRMYMNGEIGCDETCRYSYGFIPDRVTSRVTFKPRFATRFFGSVSFYAHYFSPSIQYELTGYGGFEQFFNASFREGRFEFDYSVPRTYQQIASFSSRAYTYYYRHERPYRRFEYQGVPAFNEYRCEDYFQPRAEYFSSERCENCSWYYDFYDYTGSNITYTLTYPNATYHYNAPSFPFSGYFNFTFGVRPRQYFRGRYLTEAEMARVYRRQPYSRFVFTFNRYQDNYYYNGSFYPPTYGYQPYTYPTYSFYTTRYPYFDQFNYRYYNFTFYGQRHTQVTGYYPNYPRGYFEGFRGYFTYRDFEGSYYDWFARSYFNSTFFFRYNSACSEFNSTFFGNSTYFYFYSSFFRYFRERYYSFFSQAYFNNTITYSNFTLNFEGDRYIGYFNSSRRYFMNDMYFDLTNFFPYGRYAFQPFNFYFIFPSFYQQSCYVFDKSYITFDGFRYNFNHGCKHYLIYNDDFSVIRIPQEQYYAVQVIFSQNYQGLKFYFDRQYFEAQGQRYFIDRYEEGQEYDFGEVTFRRIYSARCNSYQVFFKRFHFTVYFNGLHANFFLSPMYYGRTSGICGNMNGYAGDDTIRRHTNEYTTDVADFFNSWSHRHQSEQCRSFSYVSPVDTRSSRYREAYFTCYSTYQRLFSHCYDRVRPEYFLERCVATYMTCNDHVDTCLAPILCAYSSACYNYGFYPRNSCFYSDWSQEEYSIEYWQRYRRNTNQYDSQRFNEFARYAIFTSRFAPTYYPNYPYYYYPQNCTSTRLSQWFYGSEFTSGYGFQFCQREDNQYARFRYTYSNFFYDQCQTTGPRCCSRPIAHPTQQYRFSYYKGERCTSIQQVPTCPTGYFPGRYEYRSVTYNCPTLGERHYRTQYHTSCTYGTQ